MNDWYIDRSKNFINETLEAVLLFLKEYDGDRSSSSVIADLTSSNVFDKNDGNPNAALTRFRDHGLITNDNYLGDSARDYLSGLLNRDELVIDLFIKRPAKKKQSPDIKPFVLLCHVFWMMFDVASSVEDIYLTASECYKYLYPCDSVEDISYELVDTIISNREYVAKTKNVVEMKQNDMTNIRIWFNALKNTPLFIATFDRNSIKPNVFNRDFFEYIFLNSYRLKCTPTESNELLYNYYRDRNMGLNEIVEMPFKANAMFRDEDEIEIVYKYLFGVKKTVDFDFSYYFENDYFGIYHPFISVPGLVLRKIYMENKPLGRLLYKHLGIEVEKK